MLVVDDDAIFNIDFALYSKLSRVVTEVGLLVINAAIGLSQLNDYGRQFSLL